MSAVSRLLSAVYYQLSTVSCLLSAVFCQLSTVSYLLSAVYCILLLSSIYYQLSTVIYLLSAVYCLLSTVFYLLSALPKEQLSGNMKELDEKGRCVSSMWKERRSHGRHGPHMEGIYLPCNMCEKTFRSRATHTHHELKQHGMNGNAFHQYNLHL